MEGDLASPPHKHTRTSTYISHKEVYIFLSDLLPTHSVTEYLLPLPQSPSIIFYASYPLRQQKRDVHVRRNGESTPLVKCTPLTHIHLPIIHSLLFHPLTCSRLCHDTFTAVHTHAFILRTQFNYSFTAVVPIILY
jgi:hypothetical protein